MDGDVAELAEQVEQALDLAGPRRCVIWATVWAGGAHESFNAILRAAAARQANLELLDWAALVEDDPGLLAFDGVHGSAAGYARRAEETAALARQCVPAD